MTLYLNKFKCVFFALIFSINFIEIAQAQQQRSTLKKINKNGKRKTAVHILNSQEKKLKRELKKKDDELNHSKATVKKLQIKKDKDADLIQTLKEAVRNYKRDSMFLKKSLKRLDKKAITVKDLRSKINTMQKDFEVKKKQYEIKIAQFQRENNYCQMRLAVLAAYQEDEACKALQHFIEDHGSSTH